MYIELLRRCTGKYLDVYYYKPNPKAKEVDFVICDKGKAVELIQVAYDIDSPRTYEREISSLVKASVSLRCDRLTLVAMILRRNVEKDGKTIHISPALEWLIEEGESLTITKTITKTKR